MARVEPRPPRTPYSQPPPRRRVRSRPMPLPPREVWIGLGLIIVLCGLWILRPRTSASGMPSLLGGGVAPTARPLNAPTRTPAERPRLLPITPTVVARPPMPNSDTGVVGHPMLTPGAVPTEVTDHYVVVAGDTLGVIATRFDVTLDQLMALNNLTDPNVLEVGQVLLLPSSVQLAAPFQKVLPDSEVILSPAYQDFDVRAFIEEQGGFLVDYSEEVEGDERSGIEIVELVSQRYSLGARPLLALLEYRSGWLTEKEPQERAYPLGMKEPVRAGLFFQLSWAANRMNQGYYGKFTGRDLELRFKEGTRALYHPDTNPGTAAMQNVFAVYGTPDSWAEAMAEDGFFATYVELFGDPWARVVEPIVPPDLTQPSLQFPWERGQKWYFTGGPHGGWGDFSGWSALDFVPNDRTGCDPSSFWVTAAAEGTVIRSETGEVVVDMDGDGFVGTGWTILYMHMASAGRIGVGTKVEAGDPIGRPSCEGGFSDASHVHIARRYNGQWIEADGPVPFVMDGWRAQSTARTYDGFLRRGDESREACACREDGLNDLTIE